MALPLRSDLPTEAESPSIMALPTSAPSIKANASHLFQPGGQVGRMHAVLDARLTGSSATTAIAPAPSERFVRLLSTAGGYIAIATAYAAIVLFVLR